MSDEAFRPERWRPWGVPSRLPQASTFDVADIALDEVASAYASLCEEPGNPTP